MRILRGSPVRLYCLTALSIAVSRVLFLLYFNRANTHHFMSERIYSLKWILLPEGLLVANLPFQIQERATLFLGFFVTALVVGSFIVALPLSVLFGAMHKPMKRF